jgi:hypothetical protein
MAHRRVAGAAGIGWRTSLGSPTRGLSGSAAARWGVVLRESLWSGLVAAGDADRGVEAEAAGRRPAERVLDGRLAEQSAGPGAAAVRRRTRPGGREPGRTDSGVGPYIPRRRRPDTDPPPRRLW